MIIWQWVSMGILVLMVMGKFGPILFGNLWYWVSVEWYWLIYDGAVSVQGGTGWYLMELGQ